ncbi:SH3 domain protein [Teladorsagia circumcincta]|uniref:SH3 domain protein n=1 Tax=Teladorsagia circumcincta TaxID=45464 RepID=A0A2G9UW74_TELCI|nr:SH3 domain protein [Teladorsagia circumcincta]
MYAQGRADTQICNTRQITLVEFLEYLFYKVNDAINSLDGGQHRGYHRLVRFQHKTKDKAGLPTTVLTIPLAGEDQSLPPPSIVANSVAYSVTSPRSSCEEYEDYDKISDEGFYNSSSRQTTVIDEPANHSTLCRVLYDFEPKHDDEIQVRAGECVVVEDRLGDDWLIGHVISENGADYKTGRFPTSYVAF